LAGGSKSDYERALSLSKRTEGKVFRVPLNGEWKPDGIHFGYRIQTGPNSSEDVLINAESGMREVQSKQPSAKPVDAQLRKDLPHQTLRNGPESNISFINKLPETIEIFWLDHAGHPRSYAKLAPNGTFAMSTFAGHLWLVKTLNGKELGLITAEEVPLKVSVDGTVAPSIEKPRSDKSPASPAPAKTREAFLQNNNVMLRDLASKQVIPLSTDGTESDAYLGEIHWSPDRTKLVVMQVQPAEKHPVSFIESSPKDQLQPKLHTHDYLKPGDRIEHPRPRLFDVTTAKAIPIKDDLIPNPWSINNLEWSPDSKSFTFLYNQRGHQLLRVIRVDASTGVAKPVIEESSASFVDYSQKTFLHRLPKTHEAIWMSERDGWNHLYLYDLESGTVKTPITHGDWAVRRVHHVDEEKRQVWFFAMGIKPEQDPYHEHLCRVNLDGTGLTVLTQGDGTHKVKFSPDQRWFVDTYSRVDLPPVTELRSSADGHLVATLEKAEASALVTAGWSIPERFTAKGRDGKTDIYGVIIKPSNFDPNKKYPVVEQIYAGPHDYFVPKAWGLETGLHKMAELGFIVVQIDGMGTNWRSRAFHDVAWRNLKDAGFPDRIAWLKSAAQKRPWMDLTRVGIYGGSAGGQNALAGLLHHGDFYQVGVADCGCHDNRMDKIWWNEAWLGWPIGPWYADNSNVTHAAKLTGKLMLVVGEMDTNVDPASTMQVVNALVKADKDFDLLVMPGTNHGAAETPYASRRRMDFLVRHLMGVEPRS
jgi:dipeptidyl aminopeptidase/acylaminoacyl peptidase